jgi:hypothetical protein
VRRFTAALAFSPFCIARGKGEKAKAAVNRRTLKWLSQEQVRPRFVLSSFRVFEIFLKFLQNPRAKTA